MKTIHKKIPTKLEYSFDHHYQMHEILFFDIETTGFSADISNVYLIGCVYYKEDSWNLIQWFADDYISEVPLIKAFFCFLQNYKVLIHYNGTGFDLPYLNKKCLQYQLPYDFSQIESFDLYKKLLPFKKHLPIDNLKLKSVENLLNIVRKDCYDGGELIEIYGKYITGKFMRKPEIESYLHLLTLHNEEDIINLLSLSQLLVYHNLVDQGPMLSSFLSKNGKLIFNLNLLNPLPVPITLRKDALFLSVNGQEVTLTIDQYEGELKYFFDNYQEYFYLTKEDIAVHKSVAIFVEKDYRIKAKASNCYMKKFGVFVPQFLGNLEPNLKKDYKDKFTYLELNEDFFNNAENLHTYILNLLQFILK